MVQPPFPILDVSNDRFVACVGLAARQHVSSDAAGRPRPTFGPHHRAWAARSGRVCLYCGSLDPVGSEEHVLSVALGNWFWVVPPDVVCGTCNHKRLSVLDSKLQQHPFIALVRTLSNVPGRSGQPPKVGASNLKMARTDAGDLNVETNHAKHAAVNGNLLHASLRWTNVGPKQRADTARALLKVGLGSLWLARGPDETARICYDHVRDAVLGKPRVPMQHGHGNSVFPAHALTVMVTSDRLRPGVHVALNYFGVELWAETAGYADEAPAAFIERDTDHQYVGTSADAEAGSDRHDLRSLNGRQEA